MHMRVDQPRQHDAPAGVDGAGHVVDLQRLLADGGDALALDDDLATRAQPAGRAVEDRRVADQLACGHAQPWQMRWRATSYSRFSRATISATGTTALTAPMPWPQPQMSFQAFFGPPALPNCMVLMSPSGRLSGSSPALRIDGFR